MERGEWAQIPESGSAALLHGNARSFGTIAHEFGHRFVTRSVTRDLLICISGYTDTRTMALSRQCTDLIAKAATERDQLLSS